MLLVLALALQTVAASPSVVGFSCYGYGEKKPSRLVNIALESGVWQSDDDGRWYKISNIAPTKIWLIDDGVSHVSVIDRKTLILTDSMLVGPTKQLLQVKWACKMGPPLDVSAGRQF